MTQIYKYRLIKEFHWVIHRSWRPSLKENSLGRQDTHTRPFLYYPLLVDECESERQDKASKIKETERKED